MYRPRLLLIPAALAVLVVGTASGFAQQIALPAGNPNSDLNTVVFRMERAMESNRLHTPAYVMTRDYRLYDSKEQQLQSEVVAEVSFVPPGQKTFKIDRADGSKHGRTIVENVLTSESAATRKDSPASIDRRNYNFTWDGEGVLNGRDCWMLRLEPKREDKQLVDGMVWIDKKTYLVQLVEGDMAKNPSWWVKKVHVTARFGEVKGMWLQTGTRAVADVRLIGPHTLVGQILSVQPIEQAASTVPLNSESRRRSTYRAPRPPVLGTGVLAH